MSPHTPRHTLNHCTTREAPSPILNIAVSTYQSRTPDLALSLTPNPLVTISSLSKSVGLFLLTTETLKPHFHVPLLRTRPNNYVQLRNFIALYVYIFYSNIN